MTTRHVDSTTTDRTLGHEAWSAAAALVALLLLIPLAVFAPWLVVLAAPVVVIGRALTERRGRR